MLRLRASHPGYYELNNLQTMLIIAKNPSMFWQGLGDNYDVDELERNVIISDLEDELDKRINPVSSFNDFIDTLF